MSSPMDRWTESWKGETPTEELPRRAEVTRRRFLGGTGIAAVGTASGGIGLGLSRHFEAHAAGLNLPAALSEGTHAAAILDTLPGKKPLIKLTYRPPNYETPVEYF